MENIFNKSVNRNGTACIKWDYQEMDYGVNGLIPFSIADADYSTDQSILESIKNRVDNGVIGYSDASEEYKSAVCNWVHKRHGWDICPNWIVPTGAIVPNISFLLEVLTKEKDGVIIQPPVYDPFVSIINATNRTLIENDLILTDDDKYEINFIELEEQMKSGAKVLIFCSPHNPVGRVWDRVELEKIVSLCKKYNVYLISDEIHWDLIIGDKQHITIGQFEEDYDKIIICISASKSFNIAGLETSNFIIPNEDIRSKFQNWLYSRYLFCPNTLGMQACMAAYSKSEEWLDNQIKHIKENYDFVLEFANINMPKVKVAPLEGTYLVWFDFRYLNKTSDELVELFAKHGAGLNSGAHYGKGYEGFIRMNIACPKKQLSDGLICMKNAINNI